MKALPFLAALFLAGDNVVTIPQREAQWSEDGKYSVRIWGGKVKCFFIPPVGV